MVVVASCPAPRGTAWRVDAVTSQLLVGPAPAAGGLAHPASESPPTRFFVLRPAQQIRIRRAA
jgi:hypothetical protein